MREMSGRERAIRAMNFEPTDRLPIMANGLGSPGYVQRLTGLSEADYWADQPAAHYRAMNRLGMDFNLQLWFPPRQEESRSWARAEVEEARMPDVDEIVRDLERVTGVMEHTWTDLSVNSVARESKSGFTSPLDSIGNYK